jgi:hypothetical protein
METSTIEGRICASGTTRVYHSRIREIKGLKGYRSNTGGHKFNKKAYIQMSISEIGSKTITGLDFKR